MSHDRLGTNSLPLTQDFLAQMLGTRRSSVSIAAGILQRAGLIEHARGNATILDRQGLEQAACECYEQLQRQDWVLHEWARKCDAAGYGVRLTINTVLSSINAASPFAR